LRIGIGGNFEKGSASDYVLSKFEEEEKPLVSEMIEKGKNAVLCFFENGIEKAMNLYNDK
jgi:peptidyl-tRNA hydrolase